MIFQFKGYVVCLFLLISHSVCSQNEKGRIIDVLNTQVEAWNTGNIEGFMQGYWKNDSLKFIGKRGLTYGWAPVLNNYKKSYPGKTGMGNLVFSNLNIDILSVDYAFVTGEWSISYADKDPLGGWFSLLFKQIDKRWVIVADHSS